jgi:hypothetical protein
LDLEFKEKYLKVKKYFAVRIKDSTLCVPEKLKGLPRVPKNTRVCLAPAGYFEPADT